MRDDGARIDAEFCTFAAVSHAAQPVYAIALPDGSEFENSASAICQNTMTANSLEIRHLKNRDRILWILASQRQGNTCLPYRLGLPEEHYTALCKLSSTEARQVNLSLPAAQEDLRQELLELRFDEWSELLNLLNNHRNQQSDTELWVAEIVAAGCLGGDHLWRDLGLPSRVALRELLEENFTSLAQKNTQDMKWKKFFYKQLCEQEGSYVCRAPTCEQCAVYDDCFGPEE